MQKFTEDEIWQAERYDTAPQVKKLMENQNEIIDWIFKQDEDEYVAAAVESNKAENRKREG